MRVATFCELRVALIVRVASCELHLLRELRVASCELETPMCELKPTLRVACFLLKKGLFAK